MARISLSSWAAPRELFGLNYTSRFDGLYAALIVPDFLYQVDDPKVSINLRDGCMQPYLGPHMSLASGIPIPVSREGTR